jgi:hypothetical protein
VVRQSSHPFRWHLWSGGVNTMCHILVHALDAMWILQPTLAVLDPCTMLASTLPVTFAHGLLHQDLPGTAGACRYHSVVHCAHAVLSMARQQNCVRRDLCLVHPRSGLGAELYGVQVLPRSLQVVLSCLLHICRQDDSDPHRLPYHLPVGHTGGGSTAATWCFTESD